MTKEECKQKIFELKSDSDFDINYNIDNNLDLLKPKISENNNGYRLPRKILTALLLKEVKRFGCHIYILDDDIREILKEMEMSESLAYRKVAKRNVELI